MQRYIVPKAVLTLCLFVMAALAGAGEHKLSSEPELEEFFKQFRTAAQSKDTDRIRELSHTKSKECVNSDNVKYYDRIIKGMIRVFGHDLKIKNIGFKFTDPNELKRTAASMKKQGIKWPVDPDGRIIIKFEKPGGVRAANLHVAKDQGRWQWVHVCKN